MTVFDDIAKNAPVLDKQAEQRAKEARRIQLMGQLAQIKPAAGQNVARVAQAAAPQVTASLGEAGLAAQQAGLQRQTQVAQLDLQDQAQQAAGQQARATTAQREQLSGAANQQQLSEAAADRRQKTDFTKDEIAQQQRLQSLGMEYSNQSSFLTRKQREDLSALGGDLKQKLFDSRLAFEKDETGRKFSNDRQLMDFTVATAQSQEALQDKMQQMEQMAKRHMQMISMAQQKLTQDLQQNWNNYDAGKRREYQEAIASLKEAQRKAEAAIKRKAANKAMAVQGGTLVGTIIGSYFGGPAGGVAGGAAGGAAGGEISEATD